MGSPEEDGSGDLNILFPAIALVLAVVLNEANSRVKFLLIPDSVLIFSFALLTSILANLFIPSYSVLDLQKRYTWMDMPPNTVLYALLPPLIFESAFKIDSHMFFSKFLLIISLTTAVYVGSLFIMSALTLPIMFVVERWYPSMCILFSSMVAATDPVAVVAILEEQGAPVSLRLLVESESLLNDGLALIAYLVIRNVLEHEILGTSIEWVQHIQTLVMATVVSPIFGILAAKLTVPAINHLSLHMAKKQALLVFFVYMVFYASGEIGSAVLGLVFFGVWLSYEKERLSPEYVSTATELWHSIAFVCDSAIFVFAGQATGSSLFSDTVGSDEKKISAAEHSANANTTHLSDNSFVRIQADNLWSVVAGILMALGCLLARGLAVWIFKVMQGSSRPLKPSECVLLAYSGLRGALSLILALELGQHMRSLQGERLTWIGTQILIATSTSVFFCLMLQATTFAYFTRKEGATKRSKLVNESEHKLQFYIKAKVRETIRELRTKDGYLNGSKWDIVENVVLGTMVGIERTEPRESRCTTPTVEPQPPTPEGTPKGSQADEKEENDARVAYYSHLMAKVHNSWTNGELSGNTAKVMIQLLDHGIDEGRLTIMDFIGCVESLEPSRVFGYVYKVIDKLVHWINKLPSPLLVFSQITETDITDTKPAKNRERFTHRRVVEKGYIAVTFFCCVYTVFYMRYVLDAENSTVPREDGKPPLSDTIKTMLAAFVVIIISMYENLQHCRMHFANWRDSGVMNSSRRSNRSLRFNISNRQSSDFGFHFLRLIGSVVHILMCILLAVIAAWILFRGHCIDLIGMKEDDSCKVLSWTLFGSLFAICLYRLTRTVLTFLCLVHELLVEHKLSVDRIRLSFLHYLDTLAGDVPRELFSSNTWNHVNKETQYFKQCVEAVFRAEFKKRVEMFNVLPVIKTRQAVRMAAHKMSLLVTDLRAVGLVHGEVVAAVEDRIRTLNKQPERIIWTPQLDFREWLLCSKWFQSVPSVHKSTLIRELHSKFILGGRTEIIPAGTQIKLEGRKVAFVKSGLIHMAEWLLRNDATRSHMSHDSYAVQGDFLGMRNIMLAGSKQQKLPIKWPRIAYETRTVCEVIRIEATYMCEKLAKVYNHDNIKDVSTLHATLGREEQLRRCRIELRDLRRVYQGMNVDTLENYYSKGGRFMSKKEKLHVKEGHLLMLGCWIDILRVRPRTALTAELHVEGPAEVIVQPIDNKIGGLILIIRLMTSDGALPVTHHLNMFDNNHMRIGRSSSKSGERERGNLLLEGSGSAGNNSDRSQHISINARVKTEGVPNQAKPTGYADQHVFKDT